MTTNPRSIQSRYEAGKEAVRKYYRKKSERVLEEIRQVRHDSSTGEITHRQFRKLIDQLNEKYDSIERDKNAKLRKMDEAKRLEVFRRQSKRPWSF